MDLTAIFNDDCDYRLIEQFETEQEVENGYHDLSDFTVFSDNLVFAANDYKEEGK